jgi:hypothetical protein
MGFNCLLMKLSGCRRRHAALIKHAFQGVSSEELRQLETLLKKIGKRAESLAKPKRHSLDG